jgi:hypothetical protein
MKKLIFALSTLACGAGIYLITWALLACDSPRPGDGGSSSSTISQASFEPPAAVAPKFAEFPIGQTRVVDLGADASVLEQLTPREQRDQFRDWLLFAVLSSAGLGPEQLNQSLYDVPAVRHGYMRPVASFEYGESRSCSVGEDQILALIPEGGGAHRDALLADIADAHRKNLGTEPRTISVFEYDLDTQSQSARLTRQEDMDAHRFFIEEAKYYQAPVRSLEELGKFLVSVDDVTFASLEGGSLVLGGRKVVDHAHRSVGTEDVAAIWQAEKKLHQALTQFNDWAAAEQERWNAAAQAQFDTLNARWNKKISRINERISSGRARLRLPYEPAPPLPKTVPRSGDWQDVSVAGVLEKRKVAKKPVPPVAEQPSDRADDDFDNAPVIDENALSRREEAEYRQLEAAQRENWKAFELTIAAEQQKRKLVNGSGFSLDPDYDFEGLAAFVDRLVRELEDFSRGKGPSAVPAQELAAIRDALKRDDLDPFRAWVERLEAAEGELAPILDRQLQMARFTLRAHQGDADLDGMSRILGRLETELEALAHNRWPDDSASDFGPIRKALASRDVAPLDAWLLRMKPQDGPLAHAMWRFITNAVERYHSRSIIDRAGLDAWLGRLEAAVQKLTASPGKSNAPAELVRAAEAIARGDLAPCVELVGRWRKSDDVIASALGARLSRWEPRYKHRGRLDQKGLERMLLRDSRSLESLVTVDDAALSVKSIQKARAALARGDDAAFQKLADRLLDPRNQLAAAVLSQLRIATWRFRECDCQGLASFLGEVDDWSHALVAGDPAGLPAGWARDWIRQIRGTFKPLSTAAFHVLGSRLLSSGNEIAAALAVELGIEVDDYIRDNGPKLAEALDDIGRELRELPTLLPLDELRAAAQSLARASKSSQGRGKEADEAVVPLLTCADRLGKSQNSIAVALANHLEPEVRKYRFQMARYDGDLKGTEVGMVLFYTDLLAKLWALDYMHNQPARQIEDFHSMTDLTISPVFADEMRKLPSTRLWFGHEDKGFQVAGDGKTLILARSATRIYAASSNPLTPGKEAPAAAGSEAFLGWWNDHYSEVARYEPQYERLNEIMKWSLLISWLNEKGQGDVLGFLERVSVDHSRWFPDWVRSRPDLRFGRWDAVPVYERGYKGSTTEALPILFSETYMEFGETHTLSGGVSLAPKQLFTNRAALAGRVSPLIRRSNLNYAERLVSGKGLTFKTLQESEYTFRPLASGRSGLEVTPRAGTRLRGRMAEITTPKFERTVTAAPGQWEISARVGNHDLIALKVRPTQNGLAVGLKSRELATGQALARRASSSVDPAGTLARHAAVEAVVETPSAVMVKMRGSKSWLKLEAEKVGADATSASERVARVADTKIGAQPVDLAFVDESAAKAAVATGESNVIDVPKSSGSGLTVRVQSRGPPADAPLVRVEIEWDGGTLRGRFDPKASELYLDKGGLPPELLEQPNLVQSVIRKSGLGKLESVPAKTGPIRLVAKGTGLKESPLLQEIEQGRFRPIGEKLAGDPGEFAKQLKSDYAATLRHCDELLREGLAERALVELSTLDDVFGARPEIQFRQAVAEIKAGHGARGARLANEAISAPRADLAKLFDEVNIRLSEPKLDPATRANLSRFRDAVTWRDMHAAGKAPAGDFVLTSKTGHLDLELHIERKLSLGESVSAERLLKSDAPVYIQDSPGLNNLDWSASFQKTLDAQVQGNRVQVMTAADVGIAEFQPAKIFTGARKSTPSSLTGPGFIKVRSSRNFSSPGGLAPHIKLLNPSTSGGEEEEKRKRRLAAILAGTGESASEVFVIVPTGNGR